MKIKKEKARERISFLRREIDNHNRRYYVENKPSISDFEYDLLIHELQSLESAFPDFKSETSPTIRVGSDISESPPLKEFRQVPHKYPMLSLSNTYDKPEILSFNERIEKILGSKCDYFCELKIDGTAISLTYSGGRLLRALTRGDGTIGDDVTFNILKIPSIPKEIPQDSVIKDFEIRGEIFMPWDSFDKLNAKREAVGEPLFANPRNAASGSLKLLDSSEVTERGLDALFYHIVTESNIFETHSEYLNWAGKCGFNLSANTKLCHNIDEIFEFLDFWDSGRKRLNYPTDGVVIKINNISFQSQLGYTSKFPRWATAYKFKAERALTRLISVDYQVGRTGAVTPVANLEPVTLSGSVVKRASLHNAEQMKILDIHLGDMVYVEKGGEIIPKIIGVETSSRDYTASAPTFPLICPDCSATLVKEEDEAKYFCPAYDSCPTQIKGGFLHFCSRKAMNILAGEATIDQMYRLGYIHQLSDLYKLTKDNLLLMDGWKERAADRFLESLQKSLSTPFYKVLYALGIRHIGETSAKNLANAFGSIESLQSATKDHLLSVDDIGEIMAESVLEYFSKESNLKVINELKDLGVKFSSDNSDTFVSDKLKGMTIVVSGNFSVSRDEIKRVIEINGGKNSSSVSSATTYLVAGEKIGSSKKEKASKLGTVILSEDEFFHLIR
jgi:DNA ligase (NAD+)